MYILQDLDLNFYYVANLDSENILFGKAVSDDEIFSTSYATHEPSLFINGEFSTPDGYYQLSGKEQIANSTTLQELSLVIDKNTRAQLYKISVFGASTGRLTSTSQLYTYDEMNDALFNNATNTLCPVVKDNFECEGKEILKLVLLLNLKKQILKEKLLVNYLQIQYMISIIIRLLRMVGNIEQDS